MIPLCSAHTGTSRMDALEVSIIITGESLMNVTSVRSLRCRLLTGIAIATFLPSPSHAQQAPERPQDVESSEPGTSKVTCPPAVPRS